MLLGLLLFGMVGTGTELVLLGHTEDVWQWVPLAQIALALLALGWHALRRRAGPLRLFQAVMVSFVGSGVAGLLLHYRGNVEFEREMYPSLTGFELFWKAITGATPALAPGTMILLGLLGLVFAWRHPALHHTTGSATTSQGA
jgi:hypothetical protein